MRLVVVDASVAMKWCLPATTEDLVAEAEAMLRDYQVGSARFLVPDLFWPELGNALWKAVWKEKTTSDRAEISYQKIVELAIPTATTAELVPAALKMAMTYGRTVYDSLYVALAVHAQAELVTADERLANALAARFPVKWLGAF
ncbi:MAG: type II toxin-antitoxin system VapC family toxin [Candidatus Sulfotelmatobacter sp.]